MPIFRSSRNQFVSLAVGALLFASIGVASAQDAFDTHASDMVILQSKQIQNAIGLSAGQRDKMNVYAKDYASKMQAYQAELIKQKKTSFDQQRVGQLQQDLKSKVFAQLSAAQLKRLREISLQHDGVAALGDDVVAKKVGLSSTQLQSVRNIITADRKKLAQIQETASKPVIDKYKNLKPKNDADKKALIAKFKADMSASAKKYGPQVEQTVIKDRTSIMGVLSANQKATWNSLLGKPFKS